MKKLFAIALSALLLISSIGCAISTVNDATTTEAYVNSVNTPTNNIPAETHSACSLPFHLDSDSSGFCDSCEISVTVTVDFYAINDLHGKLLDGDSQPGVDELTSYLKFARESDDHAVFLSSGDMWQGASESNLTHGLMMTDWMNSLRFTSMTLGNHEFDWGEEFIEANLALADFPFLAINIYEKSTDALANYCTPSVTVECGEATIGIIGAIGNCYSSIAGDKVSDIYFKTGSELTALVKAESERLRTEGADFIILSIHDGSADISLSKEHVDLVFEGHTHKSYVKTDAHGIYHLQGGGDNDGITHAEAVINFAGGRSTVGTAEYIPSDKFDDSPSDPIVSELMKKYEAEVSKADEVIGTNEVFRGGDWLRALIARLYFERGSLEWGTEHDIVLGGGFISVRAPYNLSSGEVKYSDLQSLFPFDNRIDLCTVKGSDLKRKFLETSNSNYFIYCGEYGNSVKYNIDPNATYYVVVDSYTSSYAPNNLTVVASLADDLFARDLLADYIRNGGME